MKEKRPKPIQEIKVAFGTVDLDGQRANPQDYNKRQADLASAQGVIFDMRGYPNDVAMDVLKRVTTQPITFALWNFPKVSKAGSTGRQVRRRADGR